MTRRLDVTLRRYPPRHRVERHRVGFQLGERVVTRAVQDPFPPIPALGEQQIGETVGGPALEGQVERRREKQRSLIRSDGGLIAAAEGEARSVARVPRSEEHTSELQSPCNLVCRLLLEK